MSDVSKEAIRQSFEISGQPDSSLTSDF